MITVVGGGLAGVEAAWSVARRGKQVRLYEMRPATMTPAHKTGLLAELVCSNSLKTKSPDTPGGLLKAEMASLGSMLLQVAEECAVPGGEALAVDRTLFAEAATKQIASCPNIERIDKEFGPGDLELALKDGPVIIATGPLTSKNLAQWLMQVSGQENLRFYDAVSPVVDASTVDRAIVFGQSRYDKGGDDYLNCPFEKDSYLAFVKALVEAERAPLHDFEEEQRSKIPYFAGCMPIEAIAEKGERSLAFGNFKPVGLTDPRTGRRPYAALQLRPENKERTLYSLVACQNRLKWGEQKRVFQMVPGLENAEFVRFGVIHRNTYVDSPKVLRDLQLQNVPGVYLAGQITGVEGYVESAAIGILAGLLAGGFIQSTPPRTTAYGSLLAHLADDTDRQFAPMNINWGILPDPDPVPRDKGVKRQMKLDRARQDFQSWLTNGQ